MPDIYEVEIGGQTFEMESDHPPTAADIARVSASLGKAPTAEHVTSWAERLGLHTPDASPALGFAKGSAGAVVDLAEGAVSGLASTVFRGGDLIRRATGMERVIDTPEVQQAMRAPDSFAGKAGQVIEQGAEFAYPLSKVSSGAAALSWVPRMAVEGAAGAGVAGVQSGGDQSAMTLGALAPAVGSLAYRGGKAIAGAATRAAAGAAEGGIGGAVAQAMRTAVPPAPRAMLFQALKPRNTRLNFEPALDRAMPEIKAAEAQLGKPIETIDDFLTATKHAKQGIRAQIERLIEPKRQYGFTADTNAVADAIEQSIPRKVQIQDPAKAAAIKQMAQTYRSRLDIDDIDTLIRETNAELDTYYNKNPGARAKALASNPDTAQLEAEVSALREVRNQALDAPGGGAAAKELYRRYGSLMEVEDAAWRRANVAKRAAPESVSEQLSKIMAARDIARAGLRVVRGDFIGAGKSMLDLAGAKAGMQTATFLKEQNSTNNLLKRAFQLYKERPLPVEMPPPVVPIPGRGLPPKSQGPEIPSGRPPTPMGPERPDPSGVTGAPGQYGARVAVPASDIGMTVEAMPLNPQRALPPAQRALPAHVPAAQEAPALESAPPKATNPFLSKAKAARLRANALAQPTARDQAMADSFPIGAGRGGAARSGADKRIDASVSKAKAWVEADRVASRLETQAEAFEAGRINRQGRSVTPKKTSVAAKGPTPTVVAPVAPSAPLAKPEQAATKIAGQVERVVDTQGATSGADVHRRIVNALTKELAEAKQAAGFGEVSAHSLGRGRLRIDVDGRAVATMDERGAMQWQGHAEYPDLPGGGGVDTRGKHTPEYELPRVTGNATPKEVERMALANVSAAVGRMRNAGQLVVRIPGDGTFTVERNPHAIRTLLDKVLKSGPKLWKDVATR